MRGSVWDVIGPNLTLLVISLVAFSAIIYALFLIGSRASVRWQEWLRSKVRRELKQINYFRHYPMGKRIF